MAATDTDRMIDKMIDHAAELVSERDQTGSKHFDITFEKGADVVGILQSASARMRAQAYAPETLVTDDDPTESFPLPTEIYGEYMVSPELRRVGEALLDHYTDTTFQHIHENLGGMPSFAWLWRAKGGKSGGNDVLAKITAPSGLARFYAGVDFVIWVGLDNLRALEPQRWQVEALLYHELLHIGAIENVDKRTGEIYFESLTLKGHDAELFIEEVTRYGMWRNNLVRVGDAFQQRSLFDEGGGE